jgi:hypothetical protein
MPVPILLLFLISGQCWMRCLYNRAVDYAIATSSFNFDTAYLRDLFDYGHARGRSGRAWQTTLPRA